LEQGGRGGSPWGSWVAHSRAINSL
jgi:hypothetical protein